MYVMKCGREWKPLYIYRRHKEITLIAVPLQKWESGKLTLRRIFEDPSTSTQLHKGNFQIFQSGEIFQVVVYILVFITVLRSVYTKFSIKTSLMSKLIFF